MTVIEGMGFTAAEARQILLKEPLVFMQKFEEKLQSKFELLHTQVQSLAIKTCRRRKWRDLIVIFETRGFNLLKFW